MATKIDFTKKKKKISNSSSYSPSSVNSDEKVEYSINDLLEISDNELAGKIFTFDKSLQG